MLIIGLEKQADTVAGVAALAERGCLPELSPFIPDPATFLAHHRAPSADDLIDTLQKAEEAAGVGLRPSVRHAATMFSPR